MKQANSHDNLGSLFGQGPIVANIGLESFAEAMEAQELEVVRLEWRPPAGGDEEMADLLSQLL